MPPISICDALGFVPRLAVIVIGTTSRVALANKGRVDVIVTVRGKASHSSTPWVGRERDRGRAPRARSRAGGRCRRQQASRSRPGHADADRGALMAGGDPYGAGRGAAGVRSPPSSRRRSAGGVRRHRRGGGHRRSRGRSRPSSASSCIRPRSRLTAPSCATASGWMPAHGLAAAADISLSWRARRRLFLLQGRGGDACGGRATWSSGTPRTSASAVSDLVAGAVSYVGMIEEYLCP